jgi:hypothetical protein
MLTVLGATLLYSVEIGNRSSHRSASSVNVLMVLVVASFVDSYPSNGNTRGLERHTKSL